jgi:colicin import membrane protein
MNSPLSLDIPGEIVRRITAAADQLYEESGKASFPNVDAVRRKARADMNATSKIMRTWRRNQTAAATPLPASIPEDVQAASQSLLAAMWTAATNDANANLQMAQAGWEQERLEAEACRQQLASAFDNQLEELMALQREVDTVAQKLIAQDSELQAMASDNEKLRKEAAEAEGWAATAEIRASEIQKRADDLKAELARAHSNADQERLDAKSRREAAEMAIAGLREELLQKSVHENDVRQDVTRLHGQVDAMTTAHQDLIELLAPTGKATNLATRLKTNKAKSPNGPQ